MNPNVKQKAYLNLPALGFILASLLLGCALAFVTWHNIDREEQMMENFLLEEAQTLIRAFEAGARTSMMMESRNWIPLRKNTLQNLMPCNFRSTRSPTRTATR